VGFNFMNFVSESILIHTVQGGDSFNWISTRELVDLIVKCRDILICM